MEYRRLGRTELKVSLMGVGGGYVMLIDEAEGTRIYARAYELGLNYFDGRYGFSSRMQRPVIKRDRGHFVVISKTHEQTKEKAAFRIEEDLRELDTPYLDIFYLRTYNHDMLNGHLAPDGSMEALVEAKAQGKIRFIGLAGHSDLTALAKGVETGLVDAVIFPLNVVRREALDLLIPACQKYDVGVVIMKPMNVGLIPPHQATRAPAVHLRWLANQPVHTMVPGVNSLAQLEADVAALERLPLTLSSEEQAEVEAWRQTLDSRTCRICDRVCQPQCEPKLPIDWLIYHNMWSNELRVLGVEGVLQHPWAPWIKRDALRIFGRTLEQLGRCTECHKCEAVCPYHLPIVDLLRESAAAHRALLPELQKLDWATAHAGAESPFRGG